MHLSTKHVPLRTRSDLGYHAWGGGVSLKELHTLRSGGTKQQDAPRHSIKEAIQGRDKRSLLKQV